MFCNPSSKSQSNQKIKQLEDMGFNPDSARIALEMTNDDIQQATDYLLSNQEVMMMSAAIPSNSNAENKSHYNNSSSSSSTRAVRPNHPSAAVRKAGEAAANRAKFSSTFGSNKIQTPSSSFSSSSSYINPTFQTFDNHNYKSHHNNNIPSKRQQNQAFGRKWDMGTNASKKAKTFSVKKKRKTIKVVSRKKEVYSLDKDCHAWNVDGSSTDSLYNTSWIKFWEQKTGLKRGICSFADCNKEAQVGGHIWLKRKGPHIAPICNGCNYIWNAKRCQSDDGNHSIFKKGTSVVRVEMTDDMKNADRRFATYYESSSEEGPSGEEYSSSEDEVDEDKEHEIFQSYCQYFVHNAISTEVPFESIKTNPFAGMSDFAIGNTVPVRSCNECNVDISNRPRNHTKCLHCFQSCNRKTITNPYFTNRDESKRICKTCFCDISDRPTSHTKCLHCWRLREESSVEEGSSSEESSDEEQEGSFREESSGGEDRSSSEESLSDEFASEDSFSEEYS